MRPSKRKVRKGKAVKHPWTRDTVKLALRTYRWLPLGGLAFASLVYTPLALMVHDSPTGASMLRVRANTYDFVNHYVLGAYNATLGRLYPVGPLMDPWLVARLEESYRNRKVDERHKAWLAEKQRCEDNGELPPVPESGHDHLPRTLRERLQMRAARHELQKELYEEYERQRAQQSRRN